MQTSHSDISRIKYILCALCSVLGGFLNGFLGAAGGIFLGLALSQVLKGTNVASDRRDLYANIQVAMVCISLVSLALYSANGDAGLSDSTWILLPAAVGGALGSIILRRMTSNTISRIFAVLVIWSGIKMIIG